MTDAHRGNKYLVGLTGIAVAATLTLAACQVEQPTALSPDVSKALPAAATVEALMANPVHTPFTEAPQLQNRRDYAQALMEAYPPELREAGVGGDILLWVFVDETGVVRNTQLVQSSGHPRLDEAGTIAMRQAIFRPAVHDGEAVPVWIQIPVRFALR